MPELKNVRLVLEWDDSEGVHQERKWELSNAEVTHNETKNITDDHLELLRNGVDITTRATVELKMKFMALVKSEEKK